SRHFWSEEKLATEVFDYACQKGVRRRLEGIESSANSVARLKKMISNFVEFRSELVPGGCALMNTAVEADDGNAVLRARAKKALQSWMGRLSKITADGITENQIDRRMDPRKLSQLIIGTLEGALLISRLQND